MSESTAPAADNPAAGFLQRHDFLLRRLHSLSGLVPVGVFLFFHLFTNAQLLIGDFQHEVEFIHGLPALLFLEIGLWLAIGFHAALGLVYTFGGRANVGAYPYGDNWRYFFQRLSGVVALIFIFVHVSTLRWGWTYGALLDTPFFVSQEMAGGEVVPLASATTAMALQHHWVVFVFYVLGVLASVYHLANGLWTAAITWGLTVTVRAQRRWGYVCAGAFAVLAVLAALALVGAYGYQTTPRQQALIQKLNENPELYNYGHAKPGQKLLTWEQVTAKNEGA